MKICVLTTGLEWWLYLPREAGQPQGRRFTVLKLMEDPLEQLMEDLSAFLSKEKLLSGQAESRAKAVREASLEAAKLNTEVPKIWEAMLSGPDDELVELLGKRVYQQLNLRPTRDQLVTIFGGESVGPVANPVPVLPKVPPAHPSPLPPKRRHNIQPHTIELWGQKHNISSFADAFRVVINQLYERHHHEFHRVLQKRGRKYPFVARNPSELGPTGSKNPYEPSSSGYFFNITWNSVNLEKRWGEYLSLFGYTPDEVNLLYE